MRDDKGYWNEQRYADAYFARYGDNPPEADTLMDGPTEPVNVIGEIPMTINIAPRVRPDEISRTLPLRWADGQIIGTATVSPDGKVAAEITDPRAIELLQADLIGISLEARQAWPADVITGPTAGVQ